MASEQEIIEALDDAARPETRVRILDQLGHKIRPQHRKLIEYLVELSQSEQDEQVAYAVRRALFQIRTRYNITNFALFLMDPLTLLQSSDPAYRLKAVETLESTNLSLEQAYYFLGSLQFEEDVFVLLKMLKALPALKSHLEPERLKEILKGFQNHASPRVRTAVQDAMTEVLKIHDEDEIHLLWPTLQDEDRRVRVHTVHRLLQLPRAGLVQKLERSLQEATSLYELEAVFELIEEGNLAFDEQLLEAARQRLLKARKEAESAFQNDALVGKKPVPRLQWFRVPVILALLGGMLLGGWFFSGPAAPQKPMQVPAAQPQNQEEISEPSAEGTTRTSSSEDLRTGNLKEKAELFKQQGQILRQNAESFLKQASKAYEQENYSEAIVLYMALYDVYKDNRLAVDAVRQLSRTQTVKNKLESVKEYTSKKQFISAVKKLEEIKHLIGSENWRSHFERVESARKAHQEGKQ